MRNIYKPLRALLLLTLLLLARPAHAEWYVFASEAPPDALLDGGMQVCEYTGVITLSFLGDCTLGGESSARNAYGGFVQTVLREGMAYPLANLRGLLQADDISVVNLEGVLSDRSLPKTPKTYNFQGSADYAQVLALGGVELAGLANNHSGDYGRAGYADTRAALDAAGIAHFGVEHVAVWEREGVRIGFTGSSFTPGDALAGQIAALRALGCQVVIHSMHAGTEYQSAPSEQQRRVAREALRLGADLVVGHHPHIVQGYEVVDGAYVVYSLGNAVFGGNRDPRDYDALLLQAELSFAQGAAESVALRLRPIRVSGEARVNNYQPVLLYGEDAQRVLDKMARSTGAPTPPFTGDGGALTEALALPPR